MDLLTWPDGPENPKIFKRLYSDSAYEWYYGVNPVIRLKVNPLVWARWRLNLCGPRDRQHGKKKNQVATKPMPSVECQTRGQHQSGYMSSARGTRVGKVANWLHV